MADIDRIDEFRRRTGSSYEEARAFLEKHNGELLDAIIDFEQARGQREAAAGRMPKTGWQAFAEVLQKGFDVRVFAECDGRTVFGIPVLVLLLLLPYWLFLFLSLLGLMLIGFRFRVRDERNPCVDMQLVCESIRRKVNGMREAHHEAHPGGRSAGTSANAGSASGFGFSAGNPSGGMSGGGSGNMNGGAAAAGDAGRSAAKKDEGYKEYTIE